MAKFKIGDYVISNNIGLYTTKSGWIGRVVAYNEWGEVGLVKDDDSHIHWVEDRYFDLYHREPRTNRVENGDEIVGCDCCGFIIEDSEYLVLDGKAYCNDCEERKISTCEHCGELHLTDDMTEVDGEYYCEDCFDELFTECDDCGELILRDEAIYTHRGWTICRNCFDDNYFKCPECGEIYHTDDGEYDDYRDEWYCDSCYADMRRAIYNYSYKPTPIFYGGTGEDHRMYMGIELEIDDGGEDSNNARQILSMVNGDGEVAYAKHDGSINNGFEIVSHPATLEYHTNDIAWRELMAKAVELDYRSHETSTCGLHVHISREGLGDTYEAQEEVIARIIYFIEKHWKKVLTFTRRSEARMARWAARYGAERTVDDTYKNAKRQSYSRYHCINLENSATIEFRMFRGTLKYSTFLATLQFTHMLCEFCKKATNKGMERLSWNAFCKRIDREKMPELVEYLKERELFMTEEDM